MSGSGEAGLQDAAAPPAFASAAPAALSPGLSRRSRRPWVLAAAVATILISAIEGTIIATVMPKIVGELGGFDLFSWVFTAYLLTQAVTIPIYGRLADLYGRKRILLISIGLFLIGSVICGLAWSMLSLVIFRAVQGIGAGGLTPLALTIVGDLFTPAERARIQGYLSAVWAVGAVVGPLIGAFLVARTIWPMVFWINVPIGAIAAILLILALHERIEKRQHQIDYLGSLLLALGTGILMFALVEAARFGTGLLAGLLFLAMAVLAWFVRHERHTAEPMLPLALWRNPIIASGNIAWLALGAVTIGSTAFLSLDVQGVMGDSALVAGMVLAVPLLTWPFGAALGGRLMLRTSYRATVLAGALPFAIGSLMMIALNRAHGPLWASAGVALIGIGMGLTMNTFQVAIQSTVDWTQRGVATSSTVFSRIIGQAIGAAVFGGVLNASLPRTVAGHADLAGELLDPSLRDRLPAVEFDRLVTAIAQGLHNVYIITGWLIIVVAAMAFGLPRGLSPREAPARR